MNNIKAEHLSKSYKNVKVVKDVNLELNQGEIVGLLGPNGAGKTTTFYMIVGIIKPLTGKITFSGLNITSYPIYKRANLGIGYLSQESSVFRNLTVEENILLALELKFNSRKEIQQRKDFILEEFDIKKLAKNMAYSLSGGEKRKLEIARAISLEPQFILLDEPFAGVDPISVEDIQKTILYLKEKNLGILITDHNVRETLSITDRAYIMSEGSVLISGNTKEIASNELAKKVYLGENFTL